MVLKPLDLFTCLGIASSPTRVWTYAQLAANLGLSASETNAAVKRSLSAGLLVQSLNSDDKPGVVLQSLLEFLEHGVRYAFFESPGPMRRGIPTAHTAPPLSSMIGEDAGPALVWPDPEGSTRGQEFRPLYKTAPAASMRNPSLYEILALVDAIRGGRARERQLGFKMLSERLSNSHGG